MTNTTQTKFAHVPVATPDVMNGEKLPEGVTRDEINKMWQDDCARVGFPLPKANNLSMPASRTDLVKYYVGKLRAQKALDL